MEPAKDFFHRTSYITQSAVFILILIGIILEAIYGALSPIQKTVLFFFGHSALLAGSHVAFTYAQLFSLPNVKAWAYSRYDSKSRFWMIFAVLHVAFFAFFLFLITGSRETPAMNIALVLYVFFFEGVMIARHGVRQNMGIWLQMKRSNQLNKLRYAAIGRHGFNLVCIAAIWARVIVAKNALNVQAPMFLMMEQYSAIAWGIFFIGMGLILHAQFGLGGKQRESLWFISRLILFPLSMFSFVSYVGATVMHGLEFATFQNRIAKNVENKITRAILVRRSTLLILFISTLLIPRSLTFYSKDVVVGLGLVGVVATAVYGTMVFVHALIDEQMYSFRNPLVVRHIVPMLEDRSAVPEKGAS